MKKHILSVLALSGTMVCHAQTIVVTLPTVSNQNIGTQFNMAVSTATNILTGSNVKAYQFSIALPTNCTFVSIVHQAGDLGFTWGAPTSNVVGGTLTIASAGSTNITGPGTFFRIRLQAASAGTAPITFSPTALCFFNQGTPGTSLSNGSVQVNTPPTVSVGPASALLVRGEAVVCSASGGTAPYTYAALLPSVGSFAGSTFTALTQGITQVRATDAGGFQGLTAGSFDVRTYDVAVGSDQGNALHAFSVPITIGNPASVGFTAGEFQLSFDNSAFNFTGITTAGFSLAGTTITSNVVGNNLYFSFGGTAAINPVTGATLCRLNFVKDPAWSAGASSGLGLTSVLFNETLNARTTNGSLILDAPASISLSPLNATLRAGTQQLFTVDGAGTPPYTWGVSNPLAASINSSGLLTALNGGTTLVTVSDAAGNSATAGAISVYDADLTLASVSVLAGSIVHVPVVLGPSVNNEPVLSAQLHISYDATALSYVGLEQTATLSQGWSSSYSTPSGQLILSLAGTNAGTPGGLLVFLKFQTLAPLTAGSATGLTWISGLINEGDPSVQTINGTVTATDNTCGTTGCMNAYACNYDANALCDNGSCIFNPALCAVKVSPKVFLEGPFVSGTGLMGDALRTLPTFPLTEPYTSIGYAHVGGGGGETTTAGVLGVSGNNAIVDWVVVELRNAATPATVVATRSALLQRDGDVVSAIDGTSPVSLAVSGGSYYVAVRHRNHFGAMRSAASTLSAIATAVDFTSATTVTYGTNARKTVGTAQVLWSGNVVRDSNLKYTGASNDRDPILVKVGSTTPNNTVNGYWKEDVNMNGQVKYTGSGNDRDPILVNVGSTTPNNVRVEQLP